MTSKTILWIIAIVVALFLVWQFSGYGRQSGPEATDAGTTTTVPVATQPDDGWQAFTSTQYGFSVRYPQGWEVASDYAGPAGDQVKRGIAFTVPDSLSVGTNLSADSAMTVESIPGPDCAATPFLANTRQESVVQENGRSWSVAKGGGAGAGNFYDETVYAAEVGGRCFGLRLFIHSTNIGNYEPGTVNEFDRAALDAAFARFRASFTAI